MDKFYIYTNRDKDKNWEVTTQIKEYIESKGKSCTTMIGTNEDDPLDISFDTDCIIVLGGDGTLLSAARRTHLLQIPLIGINLGTLGYLADINKDTINPAIDQLIADEYTIEHRVMLYGKITRDGEEIAKDTALNDIVISRDGHPKMIYLENYVGGTILNRFRADGVIVATPTGSTGYSLSAGGPIISPEANLFLLTPLAPQSMINRSVVLPTKQEITVKLGYEKGIEGIATVTFDGATRVEIKSGDEVTIKKSNKDTLIAKISDTTFLDVLYQKMSPVNISEVLK